VPDDRLEARPEPRRGHDRVRLDAASSVEHDRCAVESHDGGDDLDPAVADGVHEPDVEDRHGAGARNCEEGRGSP
jgi:hypothetical protein